MKNKRSIFLSLIIVVALTFSVCGLSQNLPCNQSVVRAAKVKKTSQKKCKKLYNKFLKSGKWRKVENNDQPDGDPYIIDGVKVVSKKIVDFDNDGMPEMWFNVTRPKKEWSREAVSVFCAIIDGKVKMLMQGYLSDGSIGGSEIVIKYDKKTQKHVIGRSYFSGGFMGSLGG